MRKLRCVAKIENGLERRAFMAWVQANANAGYSEIGEQVTMDYQSEDPTADKKWQGIIQVFEQFKEHTIEDSEA